MLYYNTQIIIPTGPHPRPQKHIIVEHSDMFAAGEEIILPQQPVLLNVLYLYYEGVGAELWTKDSGDGRFDDGSVTGYMELECDVDSVSPAVGVAYNSFNPIDLSDYTHLQIDMEKLQTGDVTSVFNFNAGGVHPDPYIDIEVTEIQERAIYTLNLTLLPEAQRAACYIDMLLHGEYESKVRIHRVWAQV